MTMGNYFPRINSNIIGFKTPSNNKHSESGMLLRTSVDENYKRGMPVVESAVVNVLISSDTWTELKRGDVTLSWDDGELQHAPETSNKKVVTLSLT